MADPPRKPHAVLIPAPFQGHINPAVSLAIKLATRGFTVTYVDTEANHRQSSLARRRASTAGHDDIFVDARASGLDIRYELISDGLPVSFDRTASPLRFLHSLLHVSSAHVDELMRNLSRAAASPPITCLIADTFSVWPSTIAKKFGVPYVSLWTQPALVFALYYHMDLLIKHGHFASPENRRDAITYIPGVPAIEPTDLISYLRETDTSSVVHQIIFKAFEEAKGADFVLCNTVQELEPETISALRQEKRVYAIGPLISAGPTRSTVTTSLWAELDCSHWLDTKPAGSVLYISFGSYANVSKRQLEEIAHGILGGKAYFLWVVRPDIVSSDEPEPLPRGFLEESRRGRGAFVPWCRQMEVLSHPSVGGFLTHCGWNSILEAMWCGVPMLCFPLQSDQFTNRKLVVEDWKIGIDLGRIDGVCREDVSERVDSLMVGEAGHEARKKIEYVRGALEATLASDGSSQKNFDRFVGDLMEHGSKKRIITQ